MTTPRGSLLAAVDALEIASGIVRWFGTADPVPNHPAALVSRVQERLYADYYSRGRPAPSEPSGDVAPPRVDGPLAVALRATREQQVSEQPGWTLRSSDGDRLVAERERLRVTAPPQQVLRDGRTRGAARLLLPSVFPGFVPRYHLFLGHLDLDGRITSHAMRAYLHATPAGAPRLIRVIGRELDARGVPFRLKVLSDPADYRRCDAAVLYARIEDAPRVIAALADLYPMISDALRAATPALTLRLAPGIGWAEDPGGLDSYGHHRCGLIARGLVDAAERRLGGVRDRLRTVEWTLWRAGIDPRRPYLNPGSAWSPEPFA